MSAALREGKDNLDCQIEDFVGYNGPQRTMIWHHDYYVVERRLLTKEGHAAGFSISTTSVLTIDIASIRGLQHEWHHLDEEIWFKDQHGVLMVRRKMQTFDHFEAAKHYFESANSLLLIAGPPADHASSLHLWIVRAARRREMAKHTVALGRPWGKGEALLVAQTDWGKVIPQLRSLERSAP